MTSIYIHIPFCRKKCSYCDFFSVTDLLKTDNYISALLKEIDHYKDACTDEPVRTIFFGGGTPSALYTKQIALILDKLRKTFTIAEDAEISIEANPESLEEDKLKDYRSLGMNRISIGVQSLNDDDLKILGRIHDSKSAIKAVETAVRYFNNVGADLIYGLPEQQIGGVEKNLARLIKLGVQHISAYELSYEEGTPLFSARPKEDERGPEIYLFIKDFLASKGFHQYEISNYAKTGFECGHNLAYWNDQSYLGLGASAHSYDKETNTRWANTDDLAKYSAGNFLEEKEAAKPIDKIMTGLRKTSGILVKNIPIEYDQVIRALVKEDLLEVTSSHLRLTSHGQILANQVFMRFI